MTVKHMNIFLKVYQEQNITHAAGLLHMTQPAVTRAIQEIENYYGIRLFERLNRGLSATEAGKQLYAHAIHITDSFDVMEKTFRNWDKHGILRIGASITLGNFLLPKLVKSFQQEYPGINIQARVSNGRNLQDALCSNDLDLALIEGEVDEQELQMELFREDHLILVTPPGHELLSMDTIKIKDLGKYPFLLREKGSAGRTFLDHVFAVHGITLHPTWESASTQALVKAAACGLGISFLPCQLVKQNLLMGEIQTKEISDEEFRRQNYLVWHKNKFLTPAIMQFMNLLRTCQTGNALLKNDSCPTIR